MDRVKEIIKRVRTCRSDLDGFEDIFDTIEYDKDEILDCVEKFKGMKAERDVFAEFCTNIQYYSRFIEVMNNSKDLFAEYDDHNHLEHLVNTVSIFHDLPDDKLERVKNISKLYIGRLLFNSYVRTIHHCRDDFFDVTLDFFEMYHDEGDTTIDLILGNAKDVRKYDLGKYKQVLDLFMKYKDNNFNDLLSNFARVKNRIEEFLTDRAYNAIKKDRDVINRILDNNYEIISHGINIEFDYKDLDVVDRTWQMVLKVHSEREKSQWTRMRLIFVQELNRAVSQVDSYKDKKIMLRRYCNEVKQRIQENVDELMYVK